MKKRHIVLAILVVLIITLFSGCIKEEEIGVEKFNDNFISDTTCPNGMILSRYSINGDNPFRTTVKGFILRPSKGCNLPALYCVNTGQILMSQMSGGGLSCSPLNE